MPVVICPLHLHFDVDRLDSVKAEMKRRGPPTNRASYDHVTGAWLALEGTHRLRAAVELGMTPVIVAVPWPRGSRALENARFAAMLRGHTFHRVDVRGEDN